MAVKVGLLVAALVLVGTASRAAAEDGKLADRVSRRELDEQISEAARLALNAGADIFNAPTSDHAGCVLFFRGSLTTLRALLNDRPEMQKKIDQDVKDALAKPRVVDQAFALREALVNVRAGLVHMDRFVDKDPAGKTLWDRLGGEKGVTQIVDDFIDAAVKDKAVNFSRDGQYPMTDERVAKIKKDFIALTSVVAQGTSLEYKGRKMSPLHKGMGITNDEFDALIADLKLALLSNQVKPADIKTILDSVELTRGDIVAKAGAVVVKPGGAPPAPAAKLWDRLGGQEGVEKIVGDFIDAAVKDKAVNFSRDGKYPLTPEKIKEIKKQFVILASTISDGPHTYDKKLRDRHPVDMGITDAEYDAFKKNMRNALVGNNIRGDDINTVMDAVELVRPRVVAPKAAAPPAAPKEEGRTNPPTEVKPAPLGEEKPAGDTVAWFVWVVNKFAVGK